VDTLDVKNKKATYRVANEVPIEVAVECELPILTAKTSVIDIGTSIEPSNIKGKYIKK
jgi:hypothetical protein